MMASASDVSRLSNALLSLQHQYLELVEEEKPECESVFKYYLEHSNELRKKCEASLNYSKMLMLNQNFVAAFQAVNASLYIPTLKILNSSLTSHNALSKTLLKENEDTLISLLQDVFLHCSWAADSLLIADQAASGEAPAEEAPFEVDHAKTIIDISSSILERLIKNEGDSMVRFILNQHPETPDLLSQCSGYSSRNSISKLAMIFINAAEDLLEEEQKLEAILIFQATWRMILQRRRWKKMRRGFILLQKHMRVLSQRREQSVAQKFAQSEKKFEIELAAMVAKRESIEKKFRQLLDAAPNRNPRAFKLTQEENVQSASLSNRLSTEEDLDGKREAAARVLQAVVRRWLVKRQNRRPLWSKSLLSNKITEVEIRRYQEEIEFWQQKNKVPAMSQEEFQSLLHKTQFEFAGFAKSLNKSRIRDHKALVKVAQSQTILETLAQAPSLDEYHPIQRSSFHSLPLHVASKARLEHKEMMLKLSQPRWKKTLEEFG